MADKKYTVYALIDPRTSGVRYIGYTAKPLEVRLKYHYYDIQKRITSHKINWLKEMNHAGCRAGIIELESNILTIGEATTREVFWISQFTNLTNSTTGGETSKTYRADVKEKMSQNRKGKAVGKDNPMYGKKRPDLLKRNLSNNPAKNEETASKIGEKLKSMYSTPEYRKIHMDGQSTKKGVLQITKQGEIIRLYPSLRNAGLHGFGRKEIMKCINGEHKQHKGFLWKMAV